MVQVLPERHAADLLSERSDQRAEHRQLREGQLLVPTPASLCVQRKGIAAARLALSEGWNGVPLSRRDRSVSKPDELELLPRSDSQYLSFAQHGPFRGRLRVVPAG